MGTPPTPPVGVGGGLGGRGMPPGVDIMEALVAVGMFTPVATWGGVFGPVSVSPISFNFSALVILTGTSSKPVLPVPLLTGIL